MFLKIVIMYLMSKKLLEKLIIFNKKLGTYRSKIMRIIDIRRMSQLAAIYYLKKVLKNFILLHGAQKLIFFSLFVFYY